MLGYDDFYTKTSQDLRYFMVIRHYFGNFAAA